MTVQGLEIGDRVFSRESGLVHIVGYASMRSWDALCSNVYDNYQPDYWTSIQSNNDIVDPPGAEHRPRDTPVTCITCLGHLWGIENVPRDLQWVNDG